MCAASVYPEPGSNSLVLVSIFLSFYMKDINLNKKVFQALLNSCFYVIYSSFCLLQITDSKTVTFLYLIFQIYLFGTMLTLKFSLELFRDNFCKIYYHFTFLYRFGLFSKGFYCLLFNVLFLFRFAERFLLYASFFCLSTLF